MKTILCLLAIALMICGCVSQVGTQMSADKLAQIKPGQTTRAELVQWFGSPISQGLDDSGRAQFNWYYCEVHPGFTMKMKNQMLSVIVGTNNVVEKFVVTDGVNPK